MQKQISVASRPIFLPKEVLSKCLLVLGEGVNLLCLLRSQSVDETSPHKMDFSDFLEDKLLPKIQCVTWIQI